MTQPAEQNKNLTQADLERLARQGVDWAAYAAATKNAEQPFDPAAIVAITQPNVTEIAK